MQENEERKKTEEKVRRKKQKERRKRKEAKIRDKRKEKTEREKEGKCLFFRAYHSRRVKHSEEAVSYHRSRVLFLAGLSLPGGVFSKIH